MTMIVIQLNGEPYEVAATSTVADLVSALGERQERLAIEWNGSILSRELWATTELQSGDQLEIVQFVGGGSGRTVDRKIGRSGRTISGLPVTQALLFTAINLSRQPAYAPLPISRSSNLTIPILTGYWL